MNSGRPTGSLRSLPIPPLIDQRQRGKIVDAGQTFKEVVEDKRLNALAASLERKAEAFDKLRTAMRIALPEGKNGINDKMIMAMM